MERFDDVVTDPRLRRDEFLAHLDGLDRDALLFGDYRVMATSGSSGAKGVFVQDRTTFAVMAASSCASTRWPGSAHGCRGSGSRPSSAAPRRT